MDLPLLCSRRSRVFSGCVEREFDMRWNAVLASAIVSGLVPAAQGQVAFYLSGNVAGGETAFVSALSSAPTVFGFDAFSNFQPIDRLSDDIDLSLIGPLGEIRSASARVFFSGAFNTPGRVYQGAVLPSTSSASGRIRLDFDVPVEGVGAWHFDDGNTTRNHARLTVIDTLGNSHTSSILDDNSGFGHGIEGFLGAVDCGGIIAAIFESYDTLPLAWTVGSRFAISMTERPAVGICSSAAVSMTPPVEAFAVSMSGASAVTVIVSSSEPTSSVMSRLRAACVLTRTPLRSNVRNPGTPTLTV